MIEPINPIKRLWLKEIRKQKNLKTREIAELLSISFQHYNDIENGRRNPSIELAFKMADTLNIPVEKFLRERTKFKKEGQTADE